MRFPFLRSKSAPANERLATGAEPGAVQLARTQARQRLVGALVLLLVGVAVFPVLFETQPRPIGVDTPIVMPARDAGPAAPAASAVPPGRLLAASAPAAVTVLPADTGTESPTAAESVMPAIPAMPPVSQAPPVPPRLVEAAAATAAASAVQPVTAPVTATATAIPRPAPAAPPKPDDGDRAQALLDGRGAASEPRAGALRFVVQAGAYSEANALRDARQKVERLGLKTYTQVIDSDGGKRTRVRVGPFATRQEAEAVAAKVKAAGVQASILTL